MATINVSTAVNKAKEFVRSLYDEKELRHLRLDEVEISEDELEWVVTLSWVESAVKENVLLSSALGIQKLPRTYKVLRVNAMSGEVVSMKIREVEE